MKNRALFSSKDKSKKLKCRLLQLLLSALRVKGRFLEFQMYHNFAYLLSHYSESTFYKKISKRSYFYCSYGPCADNIHTAVLEMVAVFPEVTYFTLISF